MMMMMMTIVIVIVIVIVIIVTGMKMKVIRTRSIHSIYPYSAVATTYCTMQVSVNFIYLEKYITLYWCTGGV